MVHLVALLETAEDTDCVFDGRLADVDLLKAALKCRIFLDVLTVFVECGGANHAQLAAREHRLDHVARVHRAFGPASANDRMEFVDEGNDLAFGIGDLLEHRLQTLFELAAVLRSCEHRPNIKRNQALVLETLGNVAVGDARGETLDDRGLADARLTNQYGVVLGATREHLNTAPDLFVAANNRVDLAAMGQRREVLSVLLKGCELLLRALICNPVRSANIFQSLQELLRANVEAAVHCQQQVLDRQEVVTKI